MGRERGRGREREFSGRVSLDLPLLQQPHCQTRPANCLEQKSQAARESRGWRALQRGAGAATHTAASTSPLWAPGTSALPSQPVTNQPTSWSRRGSKKGLPGTPCGAGQHTGRQGGWEVGPETQLCTCCGGRSPPTQPVRAPQLRDSRMGWKFARAHTILTDKDTLAYVGHLEGWRPETSLPGLVGKQQRAHSMATVLGLWLPALKLKECSLFPLI